MNDQFEEFSGTLPSELLRRAYRSGAELAWTRTDASEAITRLENEGFTLLGVDVWVPSSPGPRVTGRFWDVDGQGGADRPQTAKQFVMTFQWGPYDAGLQYREPYFNLTVAEREK